MVGRGALSAPLRALAPFLSVEGMAPTALRAVRVVLSYRHPQQRVEEMDVPGGHREVCQSECSEDAATACRGVCLRRPLYFDRRCFEGFLELSDQFPFRDRVFGKGEIVVQAANPIGDVGYRQADLWVGGFS